jgi:hypothetical protein
MLTQAGSKVSSPCSYEFVYAHTDAKSVPVTNNN